MKPFTRIRGHTLYFPPLGTGSVVLDLGANRGEFSRQMRLQFGGRHYLVEANPTLAESLQAEGLFSVTSCAVAARSGMISFNIAVNDEGSSILPLPEASVCGCVCSQTVEIPARTLESLVATTGEERIDVLKMDIEGAEVQVLEQISEGLLRNIGQVTVEFHSDPQFGFDLRAGVETVIDLLRERGFLYFDFSGGPRSDVLFINRRFHGITNRQATWWQLRYFPPPWLRAAYRCTPKPIRTWLQALTG